MLMDSGEHSDTGYPLATKFVQVNMQYGRICGFGGILQGRIDVFYIVQAIRPRNRSVGAHPQRPGRSGEPDSHLSLGWVRTAILHEFRSRILGRAGLSVYPFVMPHRALVATLCLIKSSAL